MTVPIHSFRGLRHSTLSLILLVAFAGITGCGNDNSSGGMSSPPDWVLVPSGGRHAQSATRDYIANSESIPCMECHGADLSGGTSMVSCFENPAGCHHGPVADWVVSTPGDQKHGDAAKKAPGSSGFVSCKICHGSNFRTPRGDGSSTCYSCHSLAPHPNGPWLARAGSPYDHVTTDNANASACYDCHAYTGTENPNNPHVPPAPAPAGTAPGCYNGTMCHNQAGVPHITGSTWLNAGTGFHGTVAKADLTSCQECHGTPGTTSFNGGSAPTACSSSTCHAAAEAHPTDWQGLRTINGVTITHRTSGNRDVACAICHNVAADAAGPFAGAPSCLSATFGGSTCHSASPGGANHSVPFLGATHTSADQTSFNADCIACHAITGVSPNSAAPLCTVCHQSAATLPFTNCTSCHGDPPSGATYPNVSGKHAVHGALPGVGVCNPCHNGLEAGSLEHYDRANAVTGKNALRVPPGDVAFLAEYNAKSGGTAAFNAANRTCANVSCHGGQETPDWQTATANAIDVPNACPSCHVSGETQYNSYFSGKHSVHLDSNNFGVGLSVAAKCKLCHNEAKVNVSGHFQDLATPAFEQPARETILPTAKYNGTSCDPVCHRKENW